MEGNCIIESLPESFVTERGVVTQVGVVFLGFLHIIQKIDGAIAMASYLGIMGNHFSW